MNKWILLISLSVLLSPASAHEVQIEGLVNLQATASQEVKTDTMIATVAVEAENYDPAVLAQTINKKMAWAIAIAKTTPMSPPKVGNILRTKSSINGFSKHGAVCKVSL